MIQRFKCCKVNVRAQPVLSHSTAGLGFPVICSYKICSKPHITHFKNNNHLQKWFPWAPLFSVTYSSTLIILSCIHVYTLDSYIIRIMFLTKVKSICTIDVQPGQLEEKYKSRYRGADCRGMWHFDRDQRKVIRPNIFIYIYIHAYRFM